MPEPLPEEAEAFAPFRLPQSPLSEVRLRLAEEAEAVRRLAGEGKLPIDQARERLEAGVAHLRETEAADSEWTLGAVQGLLQPRRCPHGGGPEFCLQCGRALCPACSQPGHCARCGGPLRKAATEEG